MNLAGSLRFFFEILTVMVELVRCKLSQKRDLEWILRWNWGR